MSSLVGAIDQGTSSSRFLVFDPKDESVVAQHQVQIRSIYPKEGWVEQDPMEILESVLRCMKSVENDLKSRGIASNVEGVGITNQRETTVVWDKTTGEPLHNAIVWLDARTKTTVESLLREKAGDRGQDVIRDKCGLPISTYFSAVKLRWLLDNVPEVKAAASAGTLAFGTIDTWLIWNLTKEKTHVTDVTNASRTMLMNLSTLKWDSELLSFFDIPKGVSLPEIRSSSEIYGHLETAFTGIPVAGCLGDQQAALVGHHCFKPGMAKNTYGTGCFMLFNVGNSIVASESGMLSTVAYQMGKEAKPVYALEGSIAIAGAAVAWLKDNMGIIKEAREIGELAGQVEDTGGVHFVPAFSGLFAPHWRSDARGTICGLTQYSRREHLCRATLEAVAFQTREILEAMNKDSGVNLEKLIVDGAMTASNVLMKTQADFLGIDVVKPEMAEITCLGAAIAAGHALDVWDISPSDKPNQRVETVFHPKMSDLDRNKKFKNWLKAVDKSLGWET